MEAGTKETEVPDSRHVRRARTKFVQKVWPLMFGSLMQCKNIWMTIVLTQECVSTSSGHAELGDKEIAKDRIDHQYQHRFAVLR